MTYWHTNNLYQKTPKGFFRGTLWSQFDQTRHGFNPGWKAQGHRNGQDHKDLRPSDKEQIEPGNSNLEKMVALVARVNQWLIEIGALDLQEGLQFFLSETQTIHQMSIAHMWEHTRCFIIFFRGWQESHVHLTYLENLRACLFLSNSNHQLMNETPTIQLQCLTHSNAAETHLDFWRVKYCTYQVWHCVPVNKRLPWIRKGDMEIYQHSMMLPFGFAA